MLRFSILGTLTVTDSDGPVDLGPRKGRMLLALLLLHADRVVSTDRILETLWGDDAADREQALWVVVSRLRSALEPTRAKGSPSEVVITQDHGYRLVVEPSALDVRVFEDAADRATALIADDPRRAIEVCDEALALWRGRPFEEFADEEFLRPEIERLNALRTRVMEDRIDASLKLGREREVVEDARALHDANPLAERPVGLLMLALYRSGRQADALRTFSRHERLLGEELGVVPSPELQRLEEQILLHDTRVRPKHSEPVLPTNPYMGLRSFGEADSGRFFGRERLVADLMRRISGGEHLLTLVGASGSGKSSIVRAGLVPAIRKNGGQGLDSWVVAQMVPGAHPFTELEVALLRSSLDTPDTLREQLAEPETGVLGACLRVLPDDGRMLLVVDQFEELFTLVSDDETRNAFLAGLLTAIDDPHGRVTVVLTLRADFYAHALGHGAFGDRFGDGVVNVVPLRPDELELAARLPAEQSGLSLEPALLVAVVGDVAGRAGALPLFQYVLTELVDTRADDVLTLEAYQASGGVDGALARRADQIYDALAEAKQHVAEQLLIRLVAISDGDEWSRRRVAAGEVLSLDLDVVALSEVIDELAAHRLVTLDRDPEGAPTIEVAHESLLTEWPRLREWIARSRDDIRRHVKLANEVVEWRSADSDPDYLPTGSRLDDLLGWTDASSVLLTADERAFVAAAVDRRDQVDRDDEERRLARERAERSARSRLRGLAAAVGAVLLLATVVAFIVLDRPTRVAYLGVPNGGAVDGLLRSGLEASAVAHDIETIILEPPFTDVRDDLAQLAESGVELIIYFHGEWFHLVPDLAERYPETTWVGVDGLSAVTFAEHEGAYLAGVAAGMETNTGVVGFVGGLDYDPVRRFRAGFEAGARSVDPNITVLSNRTSGHPWFGFTAPGLGYLAARDLYDGGADVVFAAAGGAGLGIFRAADDVSRESGRHVWGIGVDSDQYFEVEPSLRDHVLTSSTKRLDEVVETIVRRFMDGDTFEDTTNVGVADGALSYTTSGDHLAPATIDAMEAARSAISDGSLEVDAHPPTASGRPISGGALIEASVVLDGTGCSIVVPGGAAAGSVMAVTAENRTSDQVWVAVRPADAFEDGGDVGIVNTLIMPVEAASTATGYFELIQSAWVAECFDGEAILTGEFTVGGFRPADSTFQVDLESCLGTLPDQLPSGSDVVIEVEAVEGIELFVAVGTGGMSLADHSTDSDDPRYLYHSSPSQFEDGLLRLRLWDLRPGLMAISCVNWDQDEATLGPVFEVVET